MKKPTSRSVSAIPKTSSRYGTFSQTDGTVRHKMTTKRSVARKASNGYAQPSTPATFRVVAEKVKAMTPAEFRASA